MDKDHIIYSTVAPVADDEPVSSESRLPTRDSQLAKSHGKSIIWLTIGMIIYMIASFAVLAWTLTGPHIDRGHIVFRTGHLKVDQFHSGLALSVLLAPAAIMIRKLSNELALIQPFAVASKHPVTLADLDKMMDPGLSAYAALSRYSAGAAFSQTFLMLVGATFVPIGTLLVTTGKYSWPATGIAETGLPTGFANDIGYLSHAMQIDGYGKQPGTEPLTDSLLAFTSYDQFLTQLTQNLFGNLVGAGGTITSTPNLLGPLSTTNITMEDGLTYSGIVTYTWDAGCEVANEISYHSYQDPGSRYTSLNFTWPDGSQTGTTGMTPIGQPFVDVWGDKSVAAAGNAIPLGPTTYFVAAHGVDDSTYVSENTQYLEFSHEWWISRVKCSPSLKWQISSCLWANGTVTDCSPFQNVTMLDIYGLDALPYYMAGLPHYLNNLQITNSGSYVFGMAPLSATLFYDPTSSNSGGVYKAPGLTDYTNLYGMIAQAIATVTTNGYYGVVTIGTVGSEPRPVYIVRTYILGIVIIILVLIPSFTICNLLSAILRRLPIRRATFLTVASAARGHWWDELLQDGWTLSPKALRKRHKNDRVTFGIDPRNPRYVGLNPHT